METWDTYGAADGTSEDMDFVEDVSNDERFDAAASVTVCPFMSTQLDAPLFRVPVSSDEVPGLDQDSFVMVDKMTTVHRSNTHAVIGRVERTTLVEFKQRLFVFSRLRHRHSKQLTTFETG